MGEEPFKLPGSSYEELASVIAAYAEFPNEASPGEVGTVVGKPSTEVSRNNGFLVSVGILTGGRRKSLTEPGRRLGRAIQHGMNEEISRAWRQIIAESDFLRKLLAAVRIRKGMERAAFVSHVAYTAGVRKAPRTMAGAGAVVDAFLVARVLEEREGQLVVAETDPGEDAPADPSAVSYVWRSGATPGVARYSSPLNLESWTLSTRRRAPDYSLQIQIQIRVGVDELETLPDKIRKFLEDYSREEEPSKDEPPE